MKNLAPIIVFTYNRLNNLKSCINSLKKNKLCYKSKIYFFSDGPKNSSDKPKIKNIRDYIRKLKGFKKKIIIERKQNFGLAKNIIHGVTHTLKKEKKAIILEDDLIVNSFFLEFMNNSLEKYEKNQKVWHISGWNYNINISTKHDCYFTRGMNCWGWGTWLDRWKHFEKKPKKIIKNWDKNKIKEFNFDNSINFYSQILRNYNNQLNSWAIFWYATIFYKKKLCLNPTKTFTQNLGISKKATNTKSIENTFNSVLTNFEYQNFNYPNKIIENEEIYKIIKRNFKLNKYKNIIKKVLYIQ